jgi:hypothetical protein
LERKFGPSFSKVFRTITVDNGTEFSDTEGMERSILHPGRRTRVYYCHPYPDGEENPSLWDMDGIPLYKYEGGEVVPRTEEELAADRGVLPKPEDKPSPEERIAELEAALAALLGGETDG